MPKIVFLGGPDQRVEVQANPGDTLLEIAEAHHIKMGSACGGVCACSSCHCWIRSGAAALGDPSEAEEDRLDQAFDVRPESRLGCQVHVGSTDLTVELTEESVQTWFNEHPDQRPQR